MKAARFGSAIFIAAVVVSCRDGGPTQSKSNPDVVAVNSTASVLAVGPWTTVHSPIPGATVTANGMAGTATMAYTSPYTLNYGIVHTWRFTTTASEAAVVTLPWAFQGFHSLYQAEARLRPYISRGGADLYPAGYLVNGAASGGFSFSGTTTFAVQAGDAYGFEVYGYHYDGVNGLYGTLTVTVPPPPSPPTATLDPVTVDEGSEASFIANAADPDGDITGFIWDFGDGTTESGTRLVTHLYPRDGVYTVRVFVSDATGLTGMATTTAVVGNVAPSVGPFPGASLLAGASYTASGSFTDPGDDTWSATVDYGDGSGLSALPLAGQSFSLSHTYATAGTFVVTVSVKDGDATGVGTATVVVAAPPPPARPPTVSLASTTAAEGSAMSLAATANDPDSDIATYSWNFGDGTTSSGGPGASHTYAQDGTYTVTVTVTDAAGLSASASASAIVSNVSPTVSALPNATLIIGGTYTAAGSFTDPGADVWSASADYGDGTGTAPVALAGKTFSLSHAYVTAGTFTVTLGVTDGSGTVQRTATVVVHSPPPPPPPPSNNPTTKDQCMKDGWKVFGFANQGLCIQYVNTGKDSRRP